MRESNKPVIEKWVEALESGNYSQGSGYLSKKNAFGKQVYCCLGVLCDLAVKEGVIPEPSQHPDDASVRIYNLWSASLPPEVRDWAGMSDGNPYVDLPDPDLPSASLAFLNDTSRYDFNSIAALIRHNFLENE